MITYRINPLTHIPVHVNDVVKKILPNIPYLWYSKCCRILTEHKQQIMGSYKVPVIKYYIFFEECPICGQEFDDEYIDAHISAHTVVDYSPTEEVQ